MDDRANIAAIAHALADAISRKDSSAVANLLADDFILRTPGGAPKDAKQFCADIEQIPVDMVFVHLEHLEIDVHSHNAIATGVQHARVRVEGTILDEHRPFVDWFIKNESGTWQVRAAVDLPALDD